MVFVGLHKATLHAPLIQGANGQKGDMSPTTPIGGGLSYVRRPLLHPGALWGMVRLFGWIRHQYAGIYMNDVATQAPKSVTGMGHHERNMQL
jgi:hypothetical protein